jgi:predicted RNA binding protein YcfA (HicA-like mRNA interferase family)
MARTRGSHRHFNHAANPDIVTIAGHPGVEIPKGTLNGIMKQA